MTTTTRSLRLVWNLIVLVAIVIYMSRFGKYSADSTLFSRLIAYPVLVLVIVDLALDRVLKRSASSDESEISPRSLLLGIALALVYLILWSPLGFALDTIVFVLVAPQILGIPWRRSPVLFALGVTTAILFLFLFHLGSGAILPRGVLNLGWF